MPADGAVLELLVPTGDRVTGLGCGRQSDLVAEGAALIPGVADLTDQRLCAGLGRGRDPAVGEGGQGLVTVGGELTERTERSGLTPACS